ncbi:MAG TPA: tryptophan synthase subunit alpha [Pyrinomonadaceae bacterium]|nr:tryptophan synthase subunit alpha [Pyrinomonadaceae bacterium]
MSDAHGGSVTGARAADSGGVTDSGGSAGASRISDAFKNLRAEGRRGFIPYITAGDPDLETTRALIPELSRAGATLIELGVPFSDPVADGPTIQRASERALRRGAGLSDVLELLADARRETDVPVILFSYFNPLLQYGVERLASDAARAGADGILATDLVPEESADFNAALAGHGLDQIFLVAPTTSDARLQMIAERASGFVYAVSRAGVTGARTDLSAEAARLVERVRAVTNLPVAVGFGISSPEHVAEVWRYADAAVVGSALVSEIEKHAGQPDLVARVGAFARRLLPH